MSDGAPGWDYPRNPFGTLLVVEVAEEHGVPASVALASTGLERADLVRPELEVAAGHELTVIRNVVRRLGDKAGLGVRAGARMTIGMLGVWGFAMLASRTTREAIGVALRYGYGEFSFLFARPWVDERALETHLVLDVSELPRDISLFLLERDLTAHAALIPQVLGSSVPLRIETTLDGRRAAAMSTALAPYPVHPGCGRNVMVVPSGVLDARLPHADEHALRRWTQHCDELIARHRSHAGRTGVAATIRAAVLREPDRTPSLEQLAAAAHLSSRTLRRQLASEGTSFRELVDEVHLSIANALLASGATVAQTAERLGYADAASFIRAFKRWTGHTPGALVGAPQPTLQGFEP